MADLTELLAASDLIVTLERLASSGSLTESDERDARETICRACRTFKLPTIAERSNVIELVTNDAAYQRTIEQVATEMGTL